MKMKAEDGKLYAEITLRDVVEKNDVSDMPLLSEVKRLYDENAKLLEQVTQLRDDWESERDYAGQMEAKEKRAVSENAKLREFVTEIMHYAKYSNPDCGLCKHYNECWADDALKLPTGCIICNEARELGIEVEV